MIYAQERGIILEGPELRHQKVRAKTTRIGTGEAKGGLTMAAATRRAVDADDQVRIFEGGCSSSCLVAADYCCICAVVVRAPGLVPRLQLPLNRFGRPAGQIW